ncbi:MAG: hypothetical protein M3404_01580 [Actinomycetota bacterium]|nr:hypothetical protein [Actinomycetota bacterium]
MRVSVTRPLKGYDAQLRRLIVAGFAGVDDRDVEIHVRSRPPRVSYRVRSVQPLAIFSAETQRRWLAAHPGSTTVPVTRVLPRRGAAERLAAQMGGRVERHVENRLGERMSGCAYEELPSMARVAPSIRYLVTLKVPVALDSLTYPFILKYRRGGTEMKTAPAIEVHNWPEEFVHLVAHEAAHVDQFRGGLAKSEVAAERWALKVLDRYRTA